MPTHSGEDRLPHLAARIGEDYADSFAACRELLATMFDLQTPRPEQRAGYTMDFDLYDYGPIKLGLSSATTAPSILIRDPGVIARIGIDHFHVQYYRANGFSMTIDGVERRVEAGDICLLDLSRPVMLQAERIDNLSAIVDRDLLAPLLADVGEVHGLVLRRHSEAGTAVREHLDDLWRQAPHLTVAQGLDLSRSTAALLAAVVRASAEYRRATRAELRKSQFKAICRRIDEQIADPGLGPDTLIRNFYVTRATLYRMFAPHGGIGRYILGRRLTGVFRDLSDPSLADARIEAILRCWGFANHTAAGRAFRKAYGITPSECRSRAREFRRHVRIAASRAFDIPAEIPANVAAFRDGSRKPSGYAQLSSPPAARQQAGFASLPRLNGRRP